jgi:predicted CXXCH cytochrome family protein
MPLLSPAAVMFPLLKACAAASGQPTADKPTGPVEGCVTPQCHGGLLDAKVVHGPAEDEECAACHTLTDPKLHAFALTSEKQELCFGCHDEIDDEVVHPPVAEG